MNTNDNLRIIFNIFLIINVFFYFSDSVESPETTNYKEEREYKHK